MIGICFTILMQSILIAFFSLSFVGIMKLRSKYASGDEKLIDTIFTFNQ